MAAAIKYKGVLPFGDPAVVEMSRRFAGLFATTTELRGLAPRQRADGQIAIVKPAALWVFDASSSASASATVLVPTSGTGRWIAATLPS